MIEAISIERDPCLQCTTVRIADVVFAEVGQEVISDFYRALVDLLHEYVGRPSGRLVDVQALQSAAPLKALPPEAIT